MSGSRVKESAPHRLIVEGRDDQWAIIALTAKHGWDWERPGPHYPYIHNAEGVEPALEALKVTILSYSRVGVVLDADLAPDNRWQAVRDRLSDTGFSLPSQPDPMGTVVENAGSRLGIWLMPDNRSPGKLEDFLALLVPPDDRCWSWAEESTAEAQRRGAPFSSPDFIKARIHAWLAWQREPGQPFGTAINAATFSHDGDTARLFLKWMERLFEP